MAKAVSPSNNNVQLGDTGQLLEQAGYCDACSAFNPSLENFTSTPYLERLAHQLGTYGEVRQRTSCPLCQLISKAYGSGPVPHGTRRGEPWHLDSLRIHGSWQQSSGDNAVSTVACIVFWLSQWAEDVKTQLVIRPITTTESQQFFARVLDDPLFDISLLKKWIHTCESTHHCMRSPHYRHPAAFKVIDVSQRCIVKGPERCRYLTLSYVWGTAVKLVSKKENIDELSQPGGLSHYWDLLSPTIQDSITLTEKLGEKYLWIDSLCIVQDGDDEKMQAIQDMDLVYSQALIMICAAGDYCPIDGLLGVRKPRNAKQYISKIDEDMSLMAQFDVSSFEDLSIYNSRGWTYQEAQLTPRSLVFSNNQVYFCCRTHVYSEDVAAEDAPAPDQVLSPPSVARRSINRDGSLSVMYFQAVETYSTRNLSFPSDILNAFTGVLNVQCEALDSDSYFGLPTAIFDMALLWQPTAQSTRRPGFPSWSWTGWTGSVKWAGDTMELVSYGTQPSKELQYEKITTWLRKYTWIDWYKYAENNKGLELVWKPSSKSSNSIGYDPTNSSHTNPYGRQHSPSKAGPTATTTIISKYQFPPKPSSSLLSPPSVAGTGGLLHFHTLTATFTIKPSSTSTYLRYGSIDPVWVPQGRLIFLLYNRHDQVCGYVMLDESWRHKYILNCSSIKKDPGNIPPPPPPTPDREQGQGEEYLFLLLSAANYYCDWRRPHEEHPYSRSYATDAYIEFHVLMVVPRDADDPKSTLGERNDNNNSNNNESKDVTVWERAGLGRVHGEAIKDACGGGDGGGAQWREVILG